MHEIHITLKSFDLHYIEKNAIFLKTLHLLLYNQTYSKSINRFDKNNKTYSKSIKKSVKNNKTVRTLSSKINNIKYRNQRDTHYYSEKSFPKKKKLITVIRGPHVDKKSREQFYFTRFKKTLRMKFINIKYAFIFLFILKNSDFYGVELTINLNYTSVFPQLKAAYLNI